jgi:hypothetical protein
MKENVRSDSYNSLPQNLRNFEEDMVGCNLSFVFIISIAVEEDSVCFLEREREITLVLYK